MRPSDDRESGMSRPSVEHARRVLASTPSVGFSLLPTPFHPLQGVTEQLAVGGSVREVPLYCKRDDLTGPAFGGNKTRKLDFLVGEALAQGADTLVAVGAEQSNFCRLTAAAAARFGLGCHLVLGKSECRSQPVLRDVPELPASEAPQGNLLLDHLLGADVHLLETTEWSEWERRGAELARDLEREGRRVYSLPVGGSTPRGALGYVAGFFEILEDMRRCGLSGGTIVHASSSAGTQAGLLVGRAITGWTGRIIGVGVAKRGEELATEVLDLAQKLARDFEVEIHSSDIEVDDSYQGEGYGATTPQSEEALSLFARTEGLMLDRVYTAKAAAALVDYLRQGRFDPSQPVVFLHTGGNVELFA
jgi:L-cysteate sulfo-lyase